MATVNCWGSNVPVEIAKGGTNATSMATSTGIVKYDGTSLVTSSTALIDSSNRYTNTSQPAFLAYLPSIVNNVTGNGASFMLGTTTALTEVFDQGNNFVTSGTFTAPVTGKYFMGGNAFLTGATIAFAIIITLTTSNRLYDARSYRPAGSSHLNKMIYVLADMDAGDTATLSVACYGEAGNTDDISGAASDVVTWFCGYLVC